MVLKKNFRQISFLHVYHHVTIFLIWWFIIYAYPCGDCEIFFFFFFFSGRDSPPISLFHSPAYFSASQNSFVHVVMYSYYLMSMLKIPTPWKKVITYVQMLQFVLNVGQAAYYLYWLKQEPALPMRILLVYCISLLILFNNYLQGQKREAKRAKAKADEVKKAQ